MKVMFGKYCTERKRIEGGSGMVEAYIKTEKGVWLCAAVVKSGRDMREWGRPMRRQSYAKGCFHHIKGIIYSAQAAECTSLPINVFTAHSMHCKYIFFLFTVLHRYTSTNLTHVTLISTSLTYQQQLKEQHVHVVGGTHEPSTTEITMFVPGIRAWLSNKN